MSNPLSGVRVVDLTSNIAAPFAGAVLADLGAHVVHVEPPHGDDSRRMNPVIEQESAYFRVVNRRKEFLTLDLRIQEDVATLMNMIGQADVFLTNLRPKRLNELGLNESSLREKHPHLITGYLTAYGDHTPEGNQAGYDGVVQARTGIVGVTGSGEPARAGVSVLDIGSGTWLALGVISALFHRERTGIGSCISTSLMETGVHWSSYHIAAHQISGEVSRRSGTGHPAFEPYGIYDTSDGQVLIGVGGDSVFIRLARALGADWMIDDPRFLSNTQRVAHREALRVELEAIVNKLTNTQVINALRQADVPVDIVQLPEDLLHDPSASAQLGNQAMRIPALPFRINNTYPGN